MTRTDELRDARRYLADQVCFWAAESQRAAAFNSDLEPAFLAQSELAFARLSELTNFSDTYPCLDSVPTDLWLSFAKSMVDYIDAADEVFQLGEDEGFA